MAGPIPRAPQPTLGQATVSQFTATGTGVVRIDVLATAQGHSATATITQTNYATAAQAASRVNPSGGSGGGGIGAGKIIAMTAAAAAAGGYVVYDRLIDAPFQPAFTCLGSAEVFRANAPQGIAGVTTIFLDYDTCLQWEVGRTTFSIDWGDGETWSGNPDDFNNMHVYRSAGTFTIRMTITDKSGLSASRETTVTIRSMTGSWRPTAARSPLSRTVWP